MNPSVMTTAYSGSCGGVGNRLVTDVRRLKSVPVGLALSSVVVTISNGASYDQLFQKVPQEGIEGTYVMTYQISGSLKPVLEALQTGVLAQRQASDLGALVHDVSAVDPNSVVFNWECCAACTGETFGTTAENQAALDLIAFLLKKGHMVMCSDFSLKALIKQWRSTDLGPNPFVKLTEFGGSMQLNFDSARLAECPSAQLQRAGDLSESGQATVHAMSSTIVYTVDQRVASQDAYALEVLTVATGIRNVNLDALPPFQTCVVRDQKGTAGHVLLRYPSGGCLLTSAGHWVELVKLDGVSEAKLLETASAQYGEAYTSSWRTQLASAPTEDSRTQMCQNFAQQMVSQSTVCSYSMTK